MGSRLVKIMLVLIVSIGLIIPQRIVAANSEDVDETLQKAFQAAIEDTTCSTVEVVLMIDQSNSMLRNDPHGYRFEEPIYITDILARNYIEARTRAATSELVSPLKIKFAAIQFASDATIALDWMSISPSNDDAWNDIQQRIIPILSPDHDQRKELFDEIGNGTNFVNAFEKLEVLFNRSEDQIGDCPQRLVLLMTDGAPDISGDSLDDSQLKSHMNEVEVISKRVLQGNNDALYVTGLNVSDDNYWERTGRYWEQIADHDPLETPTRVEKVDSYAEIGSRMSGIILTNLGDFTDTLDPGEFVVPPYLESLTLTFYKPDKSNVIQLSDENGVIDETRDDVLLDIKGEDGAIQTITIKRPAPGTYSLATDVKSDDFLITSQMIFMKAQMSQPTEAMQQFSSGMIAFQLVDMEGNIIPKYADSKYDLQLDAHVYNDDDEWPVRLTQQEDGLLLGNFTPFEHGLLHIRFTAEVLDDANQTRLVLDESTNIFDFYVNQVALKTDGFAFTSDREDCPLVQATGFSSELYLFNAQSDEKAMINYPVQWEIVKPDAVDITINGPDEEGIFTIEGISQESGTQSIEISASVEDTEHNKDILLGKIDYSPYFEPALQYTVSLERTGITKKLEGVGLFLHQIWNDVTVKENTDLTIVGREFFFRPQQVMFTARLEDGATGNTVNTSGVIPAVSLIAKDEGVNEEYQSQWVSQGNGVFTAEFEDVPFGNYQLNLPIVNTSCTVVMVSEVDINEDDLIQVAPGLSEYLLLIIFALIILTLIGLGIRWLICKFANPVKGYGRFYDRDGSRKNEPVIAEINSSCITIRISRQRIETVGIKKVKIKAIGSEKGGFRMKIFYPDHKPQWIIVKAPGVNQKVYECKDSEYRFVYQETYRDLPGSLPNLTPSQQTQDYDVFDEGNQAGKAGGGFWDD